MSRERRTVRSIEIDSPIEVKFLDQEEHDIVLCAEKQALKEVVGRTGGQQPTTTSTIVDLHNNDNTVELLETVEEDTDQRIKRKVETKRVVSEDPNTKSRITKVTKTETTEVTKVYMIKTDEDVKRAAMELGISDMSLILSDGTQENVMSKWTRPQIMQSSVKKPGFQIQNEIVTPSDFANASQGDFVLVSSGSGSTEGISMQHPQPSTTQHGVQEKQHEVKVTPTAESNRLASLCSCARRRRDTSQDPNKTERKEEAGAAVKKKEPPVSIRKRIQESARRLSAPKIEPLVDDSAKFVIKQQNLQLGTYIFDLMCKAGVYQSDAEKDRGRKVISRSLDLLYYDRCTSWPEFGNQLWLENEEYKDTNHVVTPTTNVIEYVFTNQHDLITLIDSIPDDELLAKIKGVIGKPLKPIDAAGVKDSGDKVSDIYHSVKKKLSVGGVVRSPSVGEKAQKSSEVPDVPAAYILSIIHDHERFSPDKKDSGLAEMGAKPSVDAGTKLPDVVARPEKCAHICEIIDNSQHLPQKPAPVSRHSHPGRCFSCFGDSRKENVPAKEAPVEQPVTPHRQGSQKIDAPAVHWPTITVGQAAYDTPDIILVDRRKLSDESSRPSLKIGAPIEKITVDTSKAGPVSIIASRKIQDGIDERPMVAETETVIRPVSSKAGGADDDYVKIKLAETVDILAKGALSAAEVHTDDQYFVSIKGPDEKPSEKPSQVNSENIRGIIDSHMRIPRLVSRKKDVHEDVPGGQDVSPPEQPVYKNVSDIIVAHRKFPSYPPSKTVYHDKQPVNVSEMIQYHQKIPVLQPKPLDVSAPIQPKPDSHKDGMSCTRCFSSRSRKQSRSVGPFRVQTDSKKKLSTKRTKDLPDVIKSADKHPSQLADVIQSASKVPKDKPKPAKTKMVAIEAPLFHLPDIKLSGGHNIFIAHPEYLNELKQRLNQLFPGEDADQLLNEILTRLNNDEPMEKIRASLTGRYPLAMIDLVLLSMSFVQRDYDADLIKDSQISQALVQTFDENRPMYMQEERHVPAPTLERHPAAVAPKGTPARRVSLKCFPCTSERKVTVPMSPDCIELLDNLQQLPSSHLAELSSRVSERMRVCWNLDKAHSTETSKILRKILPKLREGQVASLTVLRNELKNENPKYFYVVDPCVDVVQLLCSTHNLNQCSQPISDADIDRILSDVGQNYAGIGLFSGLPFNYRSSWSVQLDNLSELVQSTEQRLTTSASDATLTRKKRKLKKIIQDAFNLLARRQVSNTYDLRSQLHRLHPKDCALVDLVAADVEEGIKSGRLFARCSRPSVRLLINILHSQDVESCRIQDGPNDRMLSDRAIGNLQRNRDLLVSSIKTLINEPESDSLLNVQKIREEEDVDNVIEVALNKLENIKSFEELTNSLKDHVKNESTAKLLSLLLEQAYFASELEDPSGADAIGLMRDRLHGKPLVLREICFALPDHTTIQCEDHMQNYFLGRMAPSKLINVGQGLSWREANERARILFYRGKKPAVRYNDALDGFDVRMLLEQDGCIHEIPVSPNDVKKLLNSCGLYWDGLNILLLGKSDEILQRAEQEAFKILQDTGFLHKTQEEGGKEDVPQPPPQPENSS